MSQIRIAEPERLPTRSELIAWAQLTEMTGIEPAAVAELLDMGWIEPVRTGADEYLFRARDAYRMRKLLRLCRDLEISLAAGTIVVDLLERVERLEQEIAELKRLL